MRPAASATRSLRKQMIHPQPKPPFGSAGYARSAFTLIEVLVAIAIVVALLAVAVPSIISSFGDRRIEAEAERLAASMGNLRAESVRKRETLALYLEPATGDYGGRLIIGPLREGEDARSTPREDAPTSNDDQPRYRTVFIAERPLKLSQSRPTIDASDTPGQPFPDPPTATGDTLSDLIRIAVCSSSGQMLATRPLWLTDDRGMFTVEIGAGIGNVIISPWQVLPQPGSLDPEPPAEEADESVDPQDVEGLP
jgi:prepilin-type N-terminal cleavage/methylation domain-containing protein